MKNGIQKRSVYCWSIHLLYLHPAQENHTQSCLYHVLCSSEWQQNAENTLVCSSLTFITTLAMKNFFIFPFSSYIGSEKFKNWSVLHISCFQNGNPCFLIKTPPQVKGRAIQHLCVDNYPVQSLIDSIIHSIVQSIIQSIVQPRAQCGSPWLLRIVQTGSYRDPCRLTWLHNENTLLMLQVHLTYWDGNYFAGWSSIWLNGLLRSEGVVVGEQRVRSAMTSV